MVKCPNCGNTNDGDAKFCETCGANLKSTISTRSFPEKPIKKESGMAQSTKILIVICVILVAGLGITAGALMQMNKVGTVPVTNNSSVNQSSNPTSSNSQPTSSNSQYKSFNNNIIYFQFPSSWDVLPNTTNTMAIVGFSDYPSFSIYDESKYGYTIQSEQNKMIDGLPAYEIVYQGESSDGKMIIQQMELVEKSPGLQYFALVGVDNVNNYDQDNSAFNQIINSFKFVS